MSKSIEIVARGVCIQDGRLLVCRSIRHGHRYLPGGHVEWGETSPEALRREWIEELGVPCEVGDFLGIAEQVYELDGEKVAEISTVFAVSCPALSSDAADAVENHIDFAWIPLDRLEESGLLPAVIREALPRWTAAPSPAAYVATPKA